jgi:O-antigen ligase
MGRGAGLSGRTQIWEKIMEKNTHQLVGAGFRGFWESSEGESVWQELGTNRLLSSHNGYLEIYLQGGLLGLFLLLAFMLSTGLNAVDKLVRGKSFGRLALMFWPVLLIYNATESAFLQIGILWFTTLLVTIETSVQHQRVRTAVANSPQIDCGRLTSGI